MPIVSSTSPNCCESQTLGLAWNTRHLRTKSRDLSPEHAVKGPCTAQLHLGSLSFLLLRRRGCTHWRCAICSSHAAGRFVRQLLCNSRRCWKLRSASGLRGRCRVRRIWQRSCAKGRWTPLNAGMTTMASSTSRQASWSLPLH